jgi:hypothetical protein
LQIPKFNFICGVEFSNFLLISRRIANTLQWWKMIKISALNAGCLLWRRKEREKRAKGTHKKAEDNLLPPTPHSTP